MKQVFCQLCIPIRILVSFILLITIVIPSYSQELTIVSKQDYHLHDCTPDPYFSRGHFTSTERGDSLKAGDTITIYAFHKSLDWAFVYNQKKTGYISVNKNIETSVWSFFWIKTDEQSENECLSAKMSWKTDYDVRSVYKFKGFRLPIRLVRTK